MAIVKIKTVHSKAGLKNLFRYITTPEKTGEEIQISGRFCNTATAEWYCGPEGLVESFEAIMNLFPKRRLARNRVHHIMQSFAPGEVSPQKANQIGQEFMKEAGLDQYQYAVVTHINKAHVHNHIVFNPINLDTGMRLDTKRSFLYHLRDANDRVCEKHNLSVIDFSDGFKCKYTSYKEWDYAKKGISFKEHVRKQVQYVINRAESYEDFASRLIAKGYRVTMDPDHTIVIGKKKWSMRLDHLGNQFTTPKILERIRFNQEYGTLAYLMDKPNAQTSKRFIRESIEAMKASGYYEISDLALVMERLRRQRDIADMKLKLSQFELKKTERIVHLAEHIKNHADLVNRYNAATPEEKKKMQQSHEMRSLLYSYDELMKLTNGDLKMVGYYAAEYEKHWKEISELQAKKEQAEKEIRLTTAFVHVRTSETYLTMSERSILETMGVNKRRNWCDRER